MKSGLGKKLGAALALGTALVLMTVFPVLAGTYVSSIRLTFTNKYEVGEILEPEVQCGTSGLSIESVSWNKEVEKWKPGSKVTATILLSSSGKDFAATYGTKFCKISGATLLKAVKEDEYLKVTASYYPVVQLDSPDDAGWSSASKTKAVWEKVEYATGYQIRLYRDEDYIRTIDATGTSKDLSEYMNKEGYYYYEIRAVGKDKDDAKYRKSSEYLMSSNREMAELGETGGRWRNYSEGKKYRREDGTYVTGQWEKIVGKWYYFKDDGFAATGWKPVSGRWYYLDGEGVMLTGWQKIEDVWYYLDADGAMATGWREAAPGQWYYLTESGAMAANTVVDGKRLDASGLCID